MSMTPDSLTVLTPPSAANEAANALQNLVAPIARQEAQNVAATFSGDVARLQADFNAQRPVFEAAIAAAGSKVITHVEEDPQTQKAIAITIVAGAILGALIILVAYLAGNAQAEKIIGAAPMLLGSVVLLVARLGGIGTPLSRPGAK